MDEFKKLTEEIEKLDSGKWSDADFDFILEQLMEMSNRDRREVRSQIRRILLHLLKLSFQPELKGGNWRASIVNARHELEDIFEDSPSLKNFAKSVIEAQYEKAKPLFVDETGKSISIVPESCPYSFEQIMDRNFWGAL